MERRLCQGLAATVSCAEHCFILASLCWRHHVHGMQVLTHLVMRKNDIGSQAAAAFLSGQAGLKRIDLAATGINQAGMVTLCQQWSSCAANASVTDLSLASNAIGDRAANQLCAALLANRQLQCVDLSACQLGNQSGRRMLSLAQTLLHSHTAGRQHSLQVRFCLQRLHTRNHSLHQYILVTSQATRLEQARCVDKRILSCSTCPGG